MTFIIAVLILVLLSVFFMGLRAYLSFCALVAGLPMVITGLFGEKVMLFIGLCAVAYAILAAYFTVRNSPRSMLRLQILRFFGYGMFLFLQVILTMLIIFLPLAKIFGTFARSYRDVIIVNCLGQEIGRTTVDDRNRGPNGEEFKNPNDRY